MLLAFEAGSGDIESMVVMGNEAQRERSVLEARHACRASTGEDKKTGECFRCFARLKLLEKLWRVGVLIFRLLC